MYNNFLKYMLLIAILMAIPKPTQANSNDVNLAIVGGILLGALFSAGCTSFFLHKKHEEDLEKNNKKYINAIEDLAIQITILKEQLATKEVQNEQLKNEEIERKKSTFFGKLSTI